jgi:hypothetical protein
VIVPRRRGIGAGGGAVSLHTVTGAPVTWRVGLGPCAGPPVAAELRKRTIVFLARRFASLTAGCGEDEGAFNRGAVACPLHDGSPS